MDGTGKLLEALLSVRLSLPGAPPCLSDTYQRWTELISGGLSGPP